MPNLVESLARRTREAELYERLDGNRVRCVACGLQCPIPAGFAGVCKVRFNRAGKLYAPYGYVQGLHLDPIEKKPFFHVLPGSQTLSFGMLGCSLHCPYCQNWLTSQALRDFRSTLKCRPAEPQQIARMAVARGALSVISTYNEPFITSEWAAAIFRAARATHLVTGFVTNGLASPRALDWLHPWVDLYKVDLKSFDDGRYHRLGGRLAPVLDSIERIHALGAWLEVVTLLVPGFNDSPGELRALTRFLAGVSPDLPWHATAFHKNYKVLDTPDTPREALARAAAIGREAGLRYVYAPAAGIENTLCPQCGALLIERRGFSVRRSLLDPNGCCPNCATLIPGIWSTRVPPRPGSAEGWVHCRCG